MKGNLEMRHLIVGAGHMGRLYRAILKRLGQKTELVDLEFEPLKYERRHDSILICTPPETHKAILHDLPPMPTFCEKPLFVDTKLGMKYYPNQPSLLACNWLWCKHLPNVENLSITNRYPSKSKYWYWDLIHYWSYFVHKHGELTGSAGGICDGGEAWILLATKRAKIAATIINGKNPHCWVEGKIIHSTPCSMYYDQMKHWLDVLRGTPSVNPIEKSLLHHIALGNLIN